MNRDDEESKKGRDEFSREEANLLCPSEKRELYLGELVAQNPNYKEDITRETELIGMLEQEAELENCRNCIYNEPYEIPQWWNDVLGDSISKFAENLGLRINKSGTMWKFEPVSEEGGAIVPDSTSMGQQEDEKGVMGIVEEAHNVRIVGSGEKTIVLGHGLGTDQSVWKHLIPHLINEYKVILYDNMGAGPTNPDYFDFERYSTLEGYAYDLLAILEELQVDNCIYVGHSVSSMTGAVASIFRPELFSKLIFISGSPRYLNTEDYFGGFEQEDIDQLCNAIENNYKTWCDGFAPLVVGGDMDSVAVQEFSRTLFNMRPDIALCVFRTIFTFDLRHFLGRVTVPCHIIQSTKDLAVPVVVSEYLHQNLGGKSVVEVMPTEGHLPQLSSPSVTVPVVLRHISSDIG